jgi:hypothetical protein
MGSRRTYVVLAVLALAVQGLAAAGTASATAAGPSVSSHASLAPRSGAHVKGWTFAKLPVPHDAASQPGASPAVSGEILGCWRAGRCVGASSYTKKSGDDAGVLWTLSKHTWSKAKAPLPGNAAQNPHPIAEQVSCGTSGVCAVRGTYYTPAQTLNYLKNLMWTRSGGRWRAQNLPTPADSSGGYAAVDVEDVSCGGSQCAASGEYPRSADEGAALWIFTSGSWKSTPVPLPAGASDTPYPAISNVSCDATGRCVAVGDYSTAAGTDAGALWTLSRGTWQVQQAALPADESDAGAAFGFPTTSCARGTCAGILATGPNFSSRDRDVLYILANGSWSLATLPFPAGAAAGEPSTVDRVSCYAAGRCAALGRYVDSAGAVQGVEWSLRGGAWSATRAALPHDSSTNPQTTFTNLTCTPHGVCLAQGGYTSHTGGVDVPIRNDLIWSFNGHTWRRVTAVRQAAYGDFRIAACSAEFCAVLGTGSKETADDSVVWTLSHKKWHTTHLRAPSADPAFVATGSLWCGVAGGCAATGQYVDHHGNTQEGTWLYLG